MKQKPGALEDHRTRYPRELPTLEGGLIEVPRNQPSPSGTDVPNSPETRPPPASRLGSPEENEFNNVPGQGTRSSSPIRTSPPPERQPAAPMSDNTQDQADEANQVQANAMDIDYEYLFDRLLDDLPGYFHHEDLFFDNVDELDDADGDNLNENIYNENFGLPDGEDEEDHPQFQFPLDEGLDLEPEPEPDDDAGDEEGPDALCEAFQEHELIRNAYIDAFVQNVVYGATHRAFTHMLKSSRRTIAAHPNVSAEDLAKMAQTIRTAEKRLGVNNDSMITTYTLCPNCWRLYSPEDIITTENDSCLNEGCEGILFTLCTLASGGRQRVSNMTYPFASPISWIRHMLSRPGMAELIQNWRDDENGDRELSAPVSSSEWMQNLDVNRPLGDISGARGWRSTYAGLERHEDPNTGNVIDENVLDPPIRFLSLPFGISFSLNTDW